MNTEPHYADGGEPHYKRVARLGLSWCRANITKYAERAKGTPVQDLIKVIDYAVMELEPLTNPSVDVMEKLDRVQARLSRLADRLRREIMDAPEPILEDLDPPVEMEDPMPYGGYVPVQPPWPYPAGATTQAELEAGVFANLDAGLREMRDMVERRQDPSYQARVDAEQHTIDGTGGRPLAPPNQEDIEALKGYLGQSK